MIGKMIFWLCVVILCVCAYQNHVFDGLGKFVGMIKSDIDYQQNYVPEDHDVSGDYGILVIEKGEKKVSRKGGFGTVHTGY